MPDENTNLTNLNRQLSAAVRDQRILTEQLGSLASEFHSLTQRAAYTELDLIETVYIEMIQQGKAWKGTAKYHYNMHKHSEFCELSSDQVQYAWSFILQLNEIITARWNDIQTKNAAIRHQLRTARQVESRLLTAIKDVLMTSDVV